MNASSETEATTADCVSCYHQRTCNLLESIFATENVRFIVGVEIVNDDVDDVSKIKQAVRRAIERCGADVTIESSSMSSSSPPSAPFLVQRVKKSGQKQEQYLKIHEIIASEKQGQVSLRQLVNSVLAQPQERDESLFSLTIFKAPSSCFLIFNLNHALFDAITAKYVLKTIRDSLSESQPQSYDGSSAQLFSTSKPKGNKESAGSNNNLLQLIDWGELAAERTPELPNGEPNYLPLEGTPVAIAEVLVQAVGNKEAAMNNIPDSVIHLDALLCLQAARQHETTITGLWVAVLYLVTSEIYFKRKPQSVSTCFIAISVLVDLRPQLQVSSILQVQSTVVLGRTTTRQEIQQQDCAFWWSVARSSIADLRRRIQRGEAHRQAVGFAHDMSLCNPVQATIELSNHGIYPMDNVEVAQWYEGYSGLSIIVHTSGSSLTGTASSDMDSSRLMAKVKERITWMVVS